MPHRITIKDLDVRAVERALGDVRFDDEYRMAALRCCENRDIQACPGSGKTTLLVAKLAILAQKWRWKDRGILVLSHTNVARQEVQERLAKVGGHRILEYPHFVGTIQRFTNHFLALPFLRNTGIADYRIDDQVFGDRAINLLSSSREFMTAHKFLERLPNISVEIVRGLRYEGAELKLGSARQDLPCGEQTPSGKQLRKLKKAISTEDRIFRYDDMFALAERYIKKHYWIAPALRYRFPWVLIDEMQDTDGLQDRLLQLAFGNESLTQRIGDTNQAIFGSTFAKESATNFPRKGALQLPGSVRYCPAIAQIAKPLTRAHDYQDLVGNSRVPSRRHTIFTFCRATIGEVLPAFGELLQDEYRNGLPQRFLAKAVGARKTGKAKKEEHFPFCISDYFGGFSPTAASSATTFLSFLEFARSACSQFDKSSDFSSGWELVLEGCLAFLRLQGVFDPATIGADNCRPRRYSRRSLLEQISRNGYERELRFHVFDLLDGRTHLVDGRRWHSFCDNLWSLLAKSLDMENWNEDAGDFVEWTEAEEPTVQGTAGRIANTYVHKSTGTVPDFKIELSTIHAAKGETHTATLLLDTFERTHDLKSVLPFLVGSKRKITASDRKRMKRTFVAMTRPRELLCLAMHQDHISFAHRKKLEEDWSFVDL